MLEMSRLAPIFICPKCALAQAVKTVLQTNTNSVLVRNIASASAASQKKKSSCMRAWQIHQYGGNEELSLSTTMRIPHIQEPKDILVQVHAASVNPIDARMRGGYGKSLINVLRYGYGNLKSGTEFPLTLGRDFSGVIVQTGRGVKNFKQGDEVWGAVGAQRQGTHAEFVVAGENEISKKPASLTHIEAASIPYVAVTSWTALCSVGELTEKNTQDKRILIHGGSGGIGTFSIQLMSAWGAEVTTTCSTDAVEMVEKLGALKVVDYKTQDVQAELRKVDGFDLILDPVGGETLNYSMDLLKKWTNAKYVNIVTPFMSDVDKFGLPGLIKSASTLGFDALKGSRDGRSYRWAFFVPNGKALQTIAKMVDEEQIHPIVEKVFPFDQIPDAYEKVGARHGRGKTVISMV